MLTRYLSDQLADLRRERLRWKAVAFAAFLTSCGASHQPEATDVQWHVAKVPNGGGYRVTGGATLTKGVDGMYSPSVTLVDDRGCRNQIDLPHTPFFSEESAGLARAAFDKVLDVKRPVATAEFTITHDTLVDDRLSQTTVYRGEGTIDATVHPPADPTNPCNKKRSSVGVAHPTRAQLRERAKTDPDGADAQAIAGMSRGELTATAINTAGFLCARVTDLYPDSSGKIIAHCVEYRNGRGRKTYRIDADGSSVEEVD